MTKQYNEKKETLAIIIGALIIGMVFLFTSYPSVELTYSTNLPVDELSGSVTTISFEHHETHEGDHYFVKTYVENTGGAGTSDYFAFTTPANNKTVHARVRISSDADVEAIIYEDCNITGGTNITANNNYRDSTNVALLQPIAAPIVGDCYYQLWTARTGGGRGPVGVAPGGNYEIIAKYNTTYVFNLTKKTTADTVIDVDFWWYEEG